MWIRCCSYTKLTATPHTDREWVVVEGRQLFQVLSDVRRFSRNSLQFQSCLARTTNACSVLAIVYGSKTRYPKVSKIHCRQRGTSWDSFAANWRSYTKAFLGFCTLAGRLSADAYTDHSTPSVKGRATVGVNEISVKLPAIWLKIFNPSLHYVQFCFCQNKNQQ